MSAIQKHIEGDFRVELAEAERIWIDYLARRLLAEDYIILAMAITRGLVEMMEMFGKPDQT